jgi:hypothetical protein
MSDGFHEVNSFLFGLINNNLHSFVTLALTERCVASMSDTRNGAQVEGQFVYSTKLFRISLVE